jgi:hypothetical protein
MRRLAFVPAVPFAFLLLAGSVPPARAGVSVEVDVNFGEALAPYGDWIQSERFGTVWTPRDVDHGWRPYTRGHWAYTDDDWTWVSDEEWGWATDHYGRWYFDADEGWLWIPGDEWAPAWVAWRHGGGYVGWAPLPPDVEVFERDVDPRIDSYAFCFVEERYMLDRAVYRKFVPAARNITFYKLTRNRTYYVRDKQRIFNRGLDVRLVEGFTGHAIVREKILEAKSAAEYHKYRGGRGEVVVFKPHAVGGSVAVKKIDPSVRNKEERYDKLERHQQQDREKLEAAEALERRKLRDAQERDYKRPQAASDEKEHLRDRHEAEKKAQAEHEQREAQELKVRQQRESKAASESKAKKQDSQQEKAKAEKQKPRKEDKKN